MSVFDNHKTVFFAGDGYSGINVNACGCTQAWWDAEVAATSAADAMAKLMDVNGTPIVDVSGVVYTDGTEQFTLTGVQAMGVEIGMLVNIHYDDLGIIKEGIYEISYVDTNYFECDDLEFVGGSGDGEVEIVIGGAMPVQDALDETTAANHSVTIYVKDVDTLIATSIDIDMGGGNNARNTFKKIIGFNTSPGDMNFGGAYHESPSEILQAGSIDNTKAVLVDGNNDNVMIFDITSDNIIIENFHFYNSGSGKAITFTGTPQNIVFRNCRTSGCFRVSEGTAENVLFDSCYAHDDLLGHYHVLGGGRHTFLNYVANLATNKNFVNISGIVVEIIGCIITGNGQYGVHCTNIGASAFVMNNTFYNLSVYGVYVNNAENIVVVNNIFALEAGASAVGLRVITAGSISYNDYNCFIETDGTPLTVGSHGSGGELPVIGEHSITVDPLFMDAAGGDFRLKRESLCLNTGKRITDGYTNMGAWPRISRIRR